jgi:hypothetical protein
MALRWTKSKKNLFCFDFLPQAQNLSRFGPRNFEKNKGY